MRPILITEEDSLKFLFFKWGGLIQGSASRSAHSRKLTPSQSKELCMPRQLTAPRPESEFCSFLALHLTTRRQHCR